MATIEDKDSDEEDEAGRIFGFWGGGKSADFPCGSTEAESASFGGETGSTITDGRSTGFGGDVGSTAFGGFVAGLAGTVAGCGEETDDDAFAGSVGVLTGTSG